MLSSWIIRRSFPIRTLYLEYFKQLFDFIGYYDFSSNIVDYPTTPASRAAADKVAHLVKKNSYCRDPFTIGQYFALGKLLRTQTEIPPPCYRIKPAAFHVWCSRKPASDCGSQAKKSISSQFFLGTASYMAIRTLDTMALNFWKVERFLQSYSRINETESVQDFRRIMSRLLSFRSLLLETADDIVDAYRIAHPSSSIPSSSSSMILPPTPGKYDQLPVLSTPQSVIDAWPVFSSHLPVMFKEGRDWQLFYCSVPRCQGRIRHYYKTCKMALCFFRPKSNSQNCWLLHHERLFTGRGRELYRDYLSKARIPTSGHTMISVMFLRLFRRVI